VMPTHAQLQGAYAASVPDGCGLPEFDMNRLFSPVLRPKANA
jgi:hypothetical protein